MKVPFIYRRLWRPLTVCGLIRLYQGLHVTFLAYPPWNSHFRTSTSMDSMVCSDEISFWDGLYFHGLVSLLVAGLLFFPLVFYRLSRLAFRCDPLQLTFIWVFGCRKNGRETPVSLVCDDGQETDAISLLCVILERFLLEGQADFKTEKTASLEKQTFYPLEV